MSFFFHGPQGLALQELAETLWQAGFKVYLAGGCVRDYLLGRPYKDLDVVTDASVEQVQSLFVKTIPVGVQFGIIRVLLHGFEFEVARFRKDGPYHDGRRPDFVDFATPAEDAARRDFTVNALFYDLKTDQVLDFVNGKKDLDQRLLKTVGDPYQRFSEDYLRVLRLLRFSCQLQFQIESETARAASIAASHLNQVSGERLGVEMVKALQADSAKALAGIKKWNLTTLFFPQWNITPSIAPFLYFNQPLDAGGTLAQWLLNFQRPICEKSIEELTDSSWKYHKDYLVITRDMTQKLKLSRAEEQSLKEVASVLAWPACWKSFRLGYRAFLSQSEWFQKIIDTALQLSVWNQEILQEASHWRTQPIVSAFLLGSDVISIKPEHRGLVLKESLYLQYEGSLLNREQALLWLKEKNLQE